MIRGIDRILEQTQTRVDSGADSRTRAGATASGDYAAEAGTSGETVAVCAAQTHRMAVAITGRTESTRAIAINYYRF